MADALYLEPLWVRVDEFDVSVMGFTPGPAGASAHTFADSIRWEVDHAQPHILGEISTDDVGVAISSPIIEQCIGSDRMAQLEHIVREASPQPRQLARADGGPRRDIVNGSRPDPSIDASLAGRALVLIDLAHDDEELRPLGQLAAAIELAAVSDQHADQPSFAELAVTSRQRATMLADRVDSNDLASLTSDDPSAARRLAGALSRVMWRDDPDTLSPLRDLDARLRRAIERAEAAERAVSVSFGLADENERPSASRAAFPRVAAAPPPYEVDADVHDLGSERDRRARQRFTVSIIDGTRLQVALLEPTRFDRRWVRVLRREGLAMLAMVPIGNTGAFDRAETPIPPGTDIDTLLIEIVDQPVPSGSRATPEQLRQAIQFGRRACRQERLGDLLAARRAWQECAARWLELGDVERSAAATRYGDAASTGTRSGEPFIADHLAG